MRPLHFFLFFIILSSCSYKSNYQDELFGYDNAQWIQDRKNIPLYDSLFYLEEQAPLFRKTFKVDKDYHNARFDKWFKNNVIDLPQSLVEKIIRKNQMERLRIPRF